MCGYLPSTIGNDKIKGHIPINLLLDTLILGIKLLNLQLDHIFSPISIFHHNI